MDKTNAASGKWITYILKFIIAKNIQKIYNHIYITWIWTIFNSLKENPGKNITDKIKIIQNYRVSDSEIIINEVR